MTDPIAKTDSDDAAAFHNRIADQWEGKYNKQSFLARVRVVDSFLHDVPLEQTRWLDAGCGTGVLSRYLAERGAAVIGVDAAPEMVQIARQQGTAATGGSMSFDTIETVESLPYGDDAFDGIVCSSVVEYLDRPADTIAEFRRVLRRGGHLLVSVPNCLSVFRQLPITVYRMTRLLGRPRPEWVGFSKNHYTAGRFAALLRGHGLDPTGHVHFGGPMGPTFGRLRLIGPLIMFAARRSDGGRRDGGPGAG